MLLNSLTSNQIAQQYKAYKAKTFGGALEKASESTEAAKAEEVSQCAAVNIAANTSPFNYKIESTDSYAQITVESVTSTTQIFSEQVDALYKKQNSLWNTRNIQGPYGVTTIVTEPLPIGWLSIDELRLLPQKQAAHRAAYDAIKTCPEPNTSLKWYEGDTLSWKEKMARIDGSIKVEIGENELPLLMEEIEKALANGESYLTVIEKFYDNKSHYSGGAGVGVYDKIFIDPYTGTVKDTDPPSSAYMNEGKILHHLNDDDAVWDLAYDLQQFLKLRVFGETGGMSESEAEDAIAEIKERQSNKCTYRYHKI